MDQLKLIKNNRIYQIASLILPVIFVGMFIFDMIYGCACTDACVCHNKIISPIIDKIVEILFYIFFILNFVLFFVYSKKANFENISLLILNSILAFFMFCGSINGWAVIFFVAGIVATGLIPLIFFIVVYVMQIVSLCKNLKKSND